MNDSPRALVAGHTYALGINQQKLDALARRCRGLGLLVPSNWRFRGGLTPGRRVPPERSYDSFQFFPARVFRPGHVASFLFDPVASWRALTRFRPEIVQIDQEVYSPAAAELAAVAKAVSAKVVVFGWENLDRPLHPVQSAARGAVLRMADALVCGNLEGARLFERWGFGGRIEVIPQLGVDPAVFHAGLRRPGEGFTAGYVGRLVREKGVDLLLEAAAALVRRGLDFRVLVCGDGPLRGELESLGGRLGLNGRTSWLGAVDHERIPEVMGRFDALVLPSRRAAAWKEQFGHVLIEAMAMGIPAVGSDSGAIPEVIGRPALVFAEDDARGLERILERLARDKDWRRAAAAYGEARVRAHYTHDRIAERLVTLWDDVRRAAKC